MTSKRRLQSILMMGALMGGESFMEFPEPYRLDGSSGGDDKRSKNPEAPELPDGFNNYRLCRKTGKLVPDGVSNDHVIMNVTSRSEENARLIFLKKNKKYALKEYK